MVDTDSSSTSRPATADAVTSKTSRPGGTLLGIRGAGLFSLLEKRPAIATASLISGYVLGFIICNTHFARYQVLHFELLQGRYLAAAVLFVVFSAPPLFIGYILGESLPRGESKQQEQKSSLLRKIVLNLLGVVLSLGFVYVIFVFVGMVFNLVSVTHGDSYSGIYLFYWGLAMLVAFMPRFLIWYSFVREGFKESSAYLLALPIQLFFLLMLSTIFGQSVYPEISAAYGGGGAWLGNLHFKSETPVRPSLLNVVILDHDSDFVTVLPCSQDLQNSPTSTLVRLEAVDRIEMLREVAISEC